MIGPARTQIAAAMELHLIADTNLFFEFKSLEQLPWHELGREPIVIVVTKPVLDEIDRHKKGSSRTRDRALEIFGRVREMLVAGVDESVIREAGPRVVLRRNTRALPDESMKEQLDFGRTDERLIGIVSALNGKASGHEVKLFTDDGGPAGMADELGVPYLLIDPAWRRPPAETTEAKRLREVEKDLALYRSQEPRITIACAGVGADRTVRVVRKMAVPLTAEEIDEALDALRLKHPAKADFVPPATSVTTEPSGDVKTVVYSAPPAEEIAAYRDARYPQWIESCRSVLQGLHVGRDEPEPGLLLRWSMTNDGTRPASQVRVEFEAKGPLMLMRLADPTDDDDAEDDGRSALIDAAPTPRLPSPPRPPAFVETVSRSPAPARQKLAQSFDIASLKHVGPLDGRLKSASDAIKALGAFGQMSPAQRELMKAASGASRVLEAARGASHLDSLMRSAVMPFATPRMERIRDIMPYVPKPRDPERFYYSWPADHSVSKGALTCELWRHQTDAEVFEFGVVLPKDGEARGVVECEVHAENLTKPGEAKVIVERKFEPLSMVGLARSLVDGCG